jgi:HSP20 family molecular chaperone IbpA
MALFRMKNDSQRLSIPVADEFEARWKREDVIPFHGFNVPLGTREGELALDVYFTDDAVVVRTAMAGVDPEDISIALHNDLLTIRGVRRDEENILSDQYVVQECHWGAFSRSVVLPVPVSAEGAEASVKNGILKIILERIPTSHVEVRVIDEFEF